MHDHQPMFSVEFDLFCLRCRYNLRTQPTAGRCPECGLAIAPSLVRPFRPTKSGAAAFRMIGVALSIWGAGWIGAGMLFGLLGASVPGALFFGATIDAAAKWIVATAEQRLETEYDVWGPGGFIRPAGGLRASGLMAAIGFTVGLVLLAAEVLSQLMVRDGMDLAGIFYFPLGCIAAFIGVVTGLVNAGMLRSAAVEIALRLGRRDLYRDQWGVIIVWILGGVGFGIATACTQPLNRAAERPLVLVALVTFLPALVLQTASAYRLAAGLDRAAAQTEAAGPGPEAGKS